MEAGVATGLQFSPVDGPSLGEAISRAVSLYQRPEIWARMQRKGMKTDVSWTNSAGKYAGLYKKILGVAQ